MFYLKGMFYLKVGASKIGTVWVKRTKRSVVINEMELYKVITVY